MLTTFDKCLVKVHKVAVSGNSLEKHLHLAPKLRVNSGSKGNDSGLVYGFSFITGDLNGKAMTQGTCKLAKV